MVTTEELTMFHRQIAHDTRFARTNGHAVGMPAGLAGLAFFAIAVPAHAQTTVGGPIFADTTWGPSGNPYTMTSSVIVGADATLTILPGTEIAIDAGLGIQIGSDGFGGGMLIARGTPLAPIILTSNATAPDEPMPGDWNTVQFNGNAVDATYDVDGNYVSGSILEYATIEFAGGGSTDTGAVTVIEAAPALQNLTIRDNARAGLVASLVTTDVLRLTDSTFESNMGTTGGGVRISGGGAHLVRGNTMMQNQASTGAGMHVSMATGISIEENLFSGNASTSGAGGVYLTQTPTAVFNENIVEMNTGSFGAGMYLQSSNDAIVSNNVFDSNVAGSNGGGVYVEAGTANVEIVDCEFTSNQASGAGGVYCRGASALITGCVFSDNASTATFGDGGGIYLDAIGVTVRDTDVTGNTSARHAGGVHIARSGALLDDVRISQNIATEDGGGVYVTSLATGATLTDCEVTDNDAGNEGGGLFWTAPGGSIAGDGATWNVIHDNFAPIGSALHYSAANGNDLAAQSVCWGLDDAAAITGVIYDFFDDSNFGFVVFTPFIDEDDCAVTTTPCPGDITGDGEAGFTDIVALQAAWGPCDGGDCPADITGDGNVNFQDLLQILNGWGPCP